MVLQIAVARQSSAIQTFKTTSAINLLVFMYYRKVKSTGLKTLVLSSAKSDECEMRGMSVLYGMDNIPWKIREKSGFAC